MPETPAPPKPTGRGWQTARDMVLSLLALTVVIFAVLGFGQGCSFSPGGPTVDQGSAPSVDESAELGGAASGVDFAVREPALQTGWRPNSADTTSVGTGARSLPVIRIGWLTPSSGYLRLSQSTAAAGDLAESETDSNSVPAATGSVEIGGQHWTVYPARRNEKSWLADVSGVRLLISGNAQDAEFRTLAQAAWTAPLVPKKG